MKKKLKLDIYTITQTICIIVSIILFFYGKAKMLYNWQLFGVMFFWTGNLVYSFKNFGQKSVFFFFNITIFVFLLSRPFISFFRNRIWWHWGYSGSNFAMNVLYLTLIGILIGAMLFQRFGLKDFDSKLEKQKYPTYRIYLMKFSLVFYFITLIVSVYGDMEKLIFVRSTSYEEFYASFSSNLPTYVQVLGLMMPYVVCIYLACMPKKGISYMVLGSYVISSFPTFLMGQRGPLILKIIFALLYFIIRDYLQDSQKWISKFEKIVIILATPLMIVLMGAFNYIRANSSIETNGFFSLIVDFFFKQGTSFDTIIFGHDFLDKLPFIDVKNYTFGSFIDSFKYGFIGQKLFNGIGLPSTNSPEKGMISNSLAHNLAYVYRKDEYLAGNGNGSSYLLEIFADYGYIGVFIASILLGIILIFLVVSFKRNNLLLSTIALICISNILFIPRSDATSWLQFIMKPTFIAPMVICFGSSFLLAKLDRLRKVSRK
ncbi:TPA: O-antigen polysaccharide polymerase Wzy family protein [Enterococcus faecalis]|nr:O-antigen polysaccharide polymerase Wzy family protein [Enterococcus faecalis]HAP3008586.1 O-antigen polysaccharide polymerase Wzy family protein [Enterococcus faecalis]